MKKKYAFVIAFLITLIVAGNYLVFADIYPEREIVIIKRALDGDTIELEDGRIIRLLNINAPEKKKHASDEATNFLKSFEGKSAGIEITGFERYGRSLGRIYSSEYINLELVRLGLAHKYLVEDSELDEYIDAEKEAMENELGIWERSNYWNCLETEINKKAEYLIIENKCNADLKGWEIKDESTKSYIIKKSGSELTIYSAKGIDEENELYWGRGDAWNDDKDSLFIRDNEGLLVYYYSYGY